MKINQNSITLFLKEALSPVQREGNEFLILRDRGKRKLSKGEFL